MGRSLLCLCSPRLPRGRPLSPFSLPVSPRASASLSFRPPFVYFLLPRDSPPPPRVTFSLGVPSMLRAIARAPSVPPRLPFVLVLVLQCPVMAESAPMSSAPSPHASPAPHGSPPMLQMGHTSHATTHPPLTPSRTTATAPLDTPHTLPSTTRSPYRAPAE